MPRGGRRSGKPGKSYANRSDLRGPLPVTSAPSTGYGTRVALEQAQQAVPLAPQPSPSAPAPGGPPAPAGPTPGDLGNFLRPSERPAEALTSGIPSGPGPGPEALGLAAADNTVDEIRALYAAFPNEHLRQLLEDDDMGWG